MKKQKDLSAVFRESERRLRVEPSSRAWEKLEHRLDEKGEKVRVLNMRWWSAAAAVLILITAVWLWNDAESLSTATRKYTPTFVEELTGDSDCNPFCMLLENRKQLPASYASPVREEVN